LNTKVRTGVGVARIFEVADMVGIVFSNIVRKCIDGVFESFKSLPVGSKGVAIGVVVEKNSFYFLRV